LIEPLQELEQKLARRPEVKYTRTNDALTIEPSEADGFRIRLRRDHLRWLVSFGDVFHEHFDDPADAIEFVGFGLSIECRLRDHSNVPSPRDH